MCFSTVQISLSNSGELALPASSPSFSRQAKRASGGTALGSYPNALCLTYSVVESPHLRAFDCIFSFSFAVTRTAIRISFIYIIPSFILFFGGIGGSKPPKSKAARKSAAFDWDFGTQSPCLLRCKTHTVGDIHLFSVDCTVRLRCKTHTVGDIHLFSVDCTVRERPHTVLIGANRAFIPFFCGIVITF